ncbi:CLUMA_CG013177, isoform A [Clunio marinus]|uniref:CLUMA_CG013177, isoform A n=1 Tax=Clunio marinus TaxID=568069 RepID=A0A1J1IN21_9DIPT|nr:CLUMA_CG013177, isoform A [Clunio marinus]
MTTSSLKPSTSNEMTSQVKARKFKKIPVFIVEAHNDVLELILPSLANRYLPFQDNLMIHFDSHPDLCVPRQMPVEVVRNRQLLIESLSIENWIVPLMYSKHINDVVWVRPSWSGQIENGRHQFSVGDCDDKIFVSSTMEYFLSDGTYKNENLLKNAKKVTLQVCESSELLELNDGQQWILDIDLDYFSTLNPFIAIYPKANTYEKLKAIFHVDKCYDQKDPEAITRYVNERNHQLEFFESIFQHMAQNGSLEKFKYEDPSMDEKFDLVKELIECLCHHYSIFDIDWFVVNDAGCTCDDDKYQLPHHETSNEQIKEMIAKFENFLLNLKTSPTLITIARSSLDGYTPPNQVELIQSQVLQVLRKIYGENLAPETLWYKNTSTNMTALEMIQPKRGSQS